MPRGVPIDVVGDPVAKALGRDSSSADIRSAIECGARNPFPEAEDIDAQAACPIALQALLPVKVIIQISGWPSHYSPP